MARSRNIKPGFFCNADLVELPPLVRLLFIGLWTVADREGRLEDRPSQIKMQLLPGDELDTVQALCMLDAKSFLTRYEVDGKHYIQIANFKKHQNPHKAEQSSTIPPPPDKKKTVDVPPVCSGTIPASCKSRSCLVLAGLIPDSLLLIPSKKPLCASGDALDDSRAENVGAVDDTPPDELLTKRGAKLTGKRLETFNRFWEAFDYKKGKAEAADSWLGIKYLTDELFAVILAAAKKEAAYRPQLLLMKRTPKMAQGWLSARRWEDTIEEVGTHGTGGINRSTATTGGKTGAVGNQCLDAASDIKPDGFFAGDFPDRSDQW